MAPRADWLLAQLPWIAPIPGTTELGRIEENVGGSTVELTRRDLAAIDEALKHNAIKGERHTKQAMKLIDR